MFSLSKIMIIYLNSQNFQRVKIQNSYDGDKFKTIQGEKIRLAWIDAPELGVKRVHSIKAKAAKDNLNDLLADSTVVNIRRITKDRFGRTIVELSKGSINIEGELVEKGLHASMKSMQLNASGLTIKYETLLFCQ